MAETTEYRGEKYDVLPFSEAIEAFNKQKEAGENVVVLASDKDGYIVVPALTGADAVDMGLCSERERKKKVAK